MGETLQKLQRGMSVIYRTLRTEDKELFKSFIRSLPSKDNYYLMVDVHDDQAIMGQSWDMITRSGRPVTFRSLRAEDEELFKSFIRSCRLFLSPRRREDRCPQP